MRAASSQQGSWNITVLKIYSPELTGQPLLVELIINLALVYPNYYKPAVGIKPHVRTYFMMGNSC